MKRIRVSLLLLGLFAVGCTPLHKAKSPDQAKNAAAKPGDDQVPVAVAKLLPADQINDKNARAQAQILEDTLKRENGQTERTETARRE